MHNMSQKREKLEKKLRYKLEREIKRLKAENGEEEEEEADGHMTESESVNKKIAELQVQNAALEADVVKVSQSQHIQQYIIILNDVYWDLTDRISCGLLQTRLGSAPWQGVA